MPQNDLRKTFKSNQFRHENIVPNELMTVEFRGNDPTDLIDNPMRIWARTDTGELSYTVDGGVTVEEVTTRSDASYINVKWFGAKGDGVTDDTAAIQAAAAVAFSGRFPLFFPSGTFVYNGTALNPAGVDFSILGSGRDQTFISLGTGKYFIDTPNGVDNLLISDLTFLNGAGAFRSTLTGSNVSGVRVFQRVNFKGYTGAAVSHNAIDSPYWKFENCIFDGLDYATTIGVALPGLTDGNSFIGCEFLRNRVHVKLGNGGNNAYFDRCDFIRFSTTRPNGPATDIWVVPRNQSTNSGAGMTVRSCKFGNENLVSGDYRVVYADEGAGSLFGDKFPNLSTVSVNFISGHVFESILLNGSGTALCPFIFSTVKNVRGVRIGPITIAGAMPTYLLEYQTIPTADRNNGDNLLLSIHGVDLGTETSLVPRTSNGVGVFRVVDPAGFYNAYSDEYQSYYVGEPIDYLGLATVGITTYTRFAAVGGVAGTDAYGESNAGDISALDTTGTYLPISASMEVGRPAWIEFDLKSSGATPLTSIYVILRYTSNGAYHWRRIVQVPSQWRRFRFPVVFREKSTTINFHFATVSGTGSVSIARPMVYHAREPINVEGRMVNASVSGTTKLGDNAADKIGFFGKTPISQPLAIPDTTGATLAQVEAEVNKLKALSRILGLMAT